MDILVKLLRSVEKTRYKLKSKHLKGLDSFLSWEKGRERKGAIMQVSDDWTGKDSQFCVFSLVYFHLQGDDNEDGQVGLVYWWTLFAILFGLLY